ncbi:MAG: hypothetical protein ACE5JJ_06925 [Nitrospinota bacterium]
MAEVAAVFAATHSPLLFRRADDVAPEVREKVFSAYERVGQTLMERGVEALVVFANDHLQAFFLDRYPALAVGVASRFRPVASQDWLPDVEGGRKGDEELGLYLVGALRSSGFDPTLCHELPLDHSVVVPLHRMGDPPIPIVPVLQNCFAPPVAPARRSYELGLAVRRALERYDKVGRVGILGTGAPAHWVGTPEQGRVDEVWDKAAIDLLLEGRAERLSAWSQQEIDAGGDGANEIRNWIAAAAAAGNTRAELRVYQPEPIWFLGVTVLEWPVGPAA